jgi:cytochrome c
MHFSKQLVASLSIALLLGACGGSGENKTATKTDSGTAATTDSSTSGKSTGSAADDKALELIAGSDCTTCHRLHQASSGSNIGPAYDQVAAKYSPAADTTVDRIVKKILAGGSGIWGTVPMTPHPQLKPDDVKTMVTYILSLKK